MEERVGRAPRFVAMLIDLVLVNILAGVLAVGVFELVGGVPQHGEYAGIFAFAFVLTFIVALGMAYLLLSGVEGFTGWTLGKLILGLRIGTADATKAPIPSLIKRWVIKNGFILWIVSGVLAESELVVYVGFLWALLSGLMIVVELLRKHDPFHDKLAKTAVFKKAQLH